MWRARMALLIAAALGVGRPAVGDGPAVARVEYGDDRLSVRIAQARVADVLAEVGRATGAEIRGQPLGPREVTAEFEEVPLVEALPRLLGEQSFTLRYGDGGRLRQIVLKGGPETPLPVPAAAAAAPVVAVAGTPPAVIVALPRRFERHRSVPLPEPLAGVLGGPTATFDQIFALATQHSDGTVRALSMQVALSALERERPLRRSLFASLRDGQEGSLGAFLRSPGGLEMLEFVAAHSREPGLQKKATTLLEQLRVAPAGG